MKKTKKKNPQNSAFIIQHSSLLVDQHMITEIIKESDELVRILTSIVKSAQQGKKQ